MKVIEIICVLSQVYEKQLFFSFGRSPGSLSLSLFGAGCGNAQVQTSDSTNNNGAAAESYSMTDVQAHNTSQNCWTAINGNVYDVTSWINQHPGGAQSIISLCGIDGSSAFNDQHGGQRRPENELASFKIGSLK